MKIVFPLTVFWIQTYIVTGAIPNCCTSKNVGGLEYNLLRVEDTSQYNCLTNCVYEKIGEPGLAYCFGTGDLKVECKGEGDPIICDDELKTLHGLLSASNNTNDIHCCENAMTINKTTCGNGTDCATVCGVIPTCAKVVTDPEEGKDHCSNSKTNTRDGRANNYYQMVIMKFSETIGPENLGSDLPCGAKSVTGDSLTNGKDCFHGTGNQTCFPVQNLLTHSFNETHNGYDGPSTFWFGPIGNNANFTLDLGCQQTFDTIQLVNTHDSEFRDAATYQFKLYVGQTNTGPWTWVLETTLEDSRSQIDPLPLQYRWLETGEKTAQFVKFELIEPWGWGGGLQYFDIERNSVGSSISNPFLYCTADRIKSLTDELDMDPTIFDITCCQNGNVTKKTCGNENSKCANACGTIDCAKIIPIDEPENQEICSNGEKQMWVKQHVGVTDCPPNFSDVACVNCNKRACNLDSPCWACDGYEKRCECITPGMSAAYKSYYC